MTEKEKNIIEFNGSSIENDYRWLSICSPHEAFYDEVTFMTFAHLYHSINFSDPRIINLISQQLTPSAAMKIDSLMAASRINRNETDEEKRDRMELCLRLKIDTYPELKQGLIDTGDKYLLCRTRPAGIESDQFWTGVLNEDDSLTGANELGKLWMKIREDL